MNNTELNFQLRREAERREQNRIYYYRPIPKLEPFHRSRAKERWIIGANRLGKTIACASDVVLALLGLDPFKRKKYSVPSQIWVLSRDHNANREVAEPWILHFLPKSQIANYDRIYHHITLTNGSRVSFKTSEAGVKSLEGRQIDGAWIDEENPEDMYKAFIARLVDKRGDLWCSMTPDLSLRGISWVQHKVWKKHDPMRQIFTGSMYDNPYLDPQEIKYAESRWTGTEAKVRIWGKFANIFGYVYPMWDEATHLCEPFKIPLDWTRVCAIDPGLNNPTGCLWLAISPDDNQYLYREYYATEHTATENAKHILGMLSRDTEGKIAEKIVYWVIDESRGRELGEGKAVADYYRKAGIPVRRARKEMWDGIELCRNILSRGKIKVFNTLSNFIEEIRVYHFIDSREEARTPKREMVEKQKDHLMSCWRYLENEKPHYINREFERIMRRRREQLLQTSEGGYKMNTGFIRLILMSKAMTVRKAIDFIYKFCNEQNIQYYYRLNKRHRFFIYRSITVDDKKYKKNLGEGKQVRTIELPRNSVHKIA